MYIDPRTGARRVGNVVTEFGVGGGLEIPWETTINLVGSCACAYT